MYCVFKFSSDNGFFCCVFLCSFWNFVFFLYGEVFLGCLCWVVIVVNECSLLYVLGSLSVNIVISVEKKRFFM